MVIALISIWIIFTLLTNGTFLSTRNLSILSRQATVTAILAIGMVLVIISANIDLSVGFGSGLLGAITAILHVWWGYPNNPDSYNCNIHRYINRCFTWISYCISTHTCVYCHARWISVISRIDVGIYKRRNYPPA